MTKPKNYKIGNITKMLGVSADTLRYYEKIGLLPRIQRNASGLREYSDQDISNIRFIKRAQQMKFTLAEISELLTMRQDPSGACDDIRQLTASKLTEIEDRIAVLDSLRKEFLGLIDLCSKDDDGCPIIEGWDETALPHEQTALSEQ